MGKEIPLLKPFSSNKITVVHTIRMHMHLIMKNSKKCYFKVSENSVSCIPYVDTYLCRFWNKKDHL
jgi:hypothetical protein